MQLTQNIEIATKRLQLVPVDPKYAAAIFANFNDQITTYMFPKTPDTIEDTLEFIQTSRQELLSGKSLQVTVLDKTTHEFLGGAGINHTNTKEPELGIWIKQSAHESKLGREAVLGLKTWAQAHLDYDHLVYPVDKANVPSRKIAEACGGKIQKQYPKKTLSGKTLNIIEYWIPK